jgi:O-antigen/teichoic acid export membrane protein
MEQKGPVDLSTAKVISDTFFVSISKIGILLLKPVRGVVLGRILGPSLYGMLNIPVPYIQIFTIFSNIGFNAALVTLIPGHLQKGRGDLAHMIYRAALVMTVALSALWAVLLIAAAPWISERLAHEPEAVDPIMLYALIIPFMALNALYAAVYLGVQRGKLRAKITAAHGLLNVALPIAAALVWRGQVLPVIGGFLTAELFGALLFFLLFHRRVLSRFGRAGGSIAANMSLIWRTGFLFFFANLGWNMINSIDRLMVKFYLPIDQYGFYAMASLVITALSIIASTTGTALIPSLTVSRARGDMALYDRQVQNTSRITFMGLVPFVVMIYVLARDVFGLVLPDFLPAVGVVKILAFIGFLDILCRVAWASLVAHGRGGLAAISYIAAAAWNVLMNWILIPRYGIEGAAIATLTSFFLLAVLLQAMMRSTSGTRVRLASLVHPLALSSVFPLLSLALGGQGHLVRIIAIPAAGSALFVFFGIHTHLIHAADIERARAALEPRGNVPHVRFALTLLAVLERARRRLRREE